MLRDLLVHVDGSQAGRRRVQFAVELAVHAGARLNGIHVTPPAEVPPQFKPSLVEEVAADLSDTLARNALAAAQIFDEETTGRLADACWFDAGGDVAQAITERARYADLVVVGQYESQGPSVRHPLPIAHAVVVRCGRPVLVVPSIPKPNWLEKVAVAWDGSREAVRAIHDALPLLRLARSVRIVVMVAAPARDGDIESIVGHLARHGIGSDTDVRRCWKAEEHASLGKAINEGRYGLLVMGAYSHPKWLEFIFGGPTRSILLTSTIPVLISH
jgi:nucleotide-binding universal stress UspA family protein